MELMTTSFDQCYKHIYGVLHQTIPEDILGMTSLAVSPLPYFSHFLSIVATLLYNLRWLEGVFHRYCNSARFQMEKD